jgi:hypothetical protein
MDQPAQHDLFGEPAHRTELVRPAVPDEQLVRVARRLPKNLHLGTSSWSFPGTERLPPGRPMQSSCAIPRFSVRDTKPLCGRPALCTARAFTRACLPLTARSPRGRGARCSFGGCSAPGEDYASAGARYAPFDRLRAPDELNRDRIAAMIGAGLSAGRDVHVVAANNAEGSAPLTLYELAKTIVTN